MEVKLGDKVCLYRQRSVLIDPAFLEDADMITLQIYEEASVIKVNPKRFWVKPSSGGKQLKCDKQGVGSFIVVMIEFMQVERIEYIF